jgi:hypothetical protein
MMTGIDAYADLLSHSAAVEEVHELATWAAQVVLAVRGSGALLPPELRTLVDQLAHRPSVIRRLNDER